MAEAVVRGVAAVAWAGPVAAGAALARGSGCISMSAAGSRGGAGTGLGASWAAVVNHAQVKPRRSELRLAGIAPGIRPAKPLSPEVPVVARPIALLPAPLILRGLSPGASGVPRARSLSGGEGGSLDRSGWDTPF